MKNYTFYNKENPTTIQIPANSESESWEILDAKFMASDSGIEWKLKEE